METTPKTKGIYLYTDSDKQYHNLRGYRNAITALNKLKTVIERSLKVVLTDAELPELGANARKFVEAKKTEFRNKFPFPQATESFNTEALGISFEPIEEAMKDLTNSNYQFAIIDGIFDESQLEIERIKRDADTFTTSEKQAEAVTIAREICEGMNLLLEMRAIQPDDFGSLHRLTSGLIHYQERKFLIIPKAITYL